MSAVSDAQVRARALDPATSFIVQAPAGSGKTGLLVQRILRLLASVDSPEEILAITFTRKAAAEMRGRVMQAIEAAHGPAPGDAHARITWQLARAVLARDAERGWALAQNTSRLRVQTIDALCASLARQMPVLSRLGATPAIVEDARLLYREAAWRTLALAESADEAGAAVRRVLRHLDGDWGAVRALLEQMLARRDQWMHRVLGFAADAEARASLEEGFRAERARLMGRAAALLPAAAAEALARLAGFAGRNLIEEGSDSPLVALAQLRELPAAGESGADAWQALVKLCLKGDGDWRVGLNRKDGFPAGPGERAAAKDEMKALLERLAQVRGLREAFEAIGAMPPARYTDAQWEVLGAIVAALPYAAAQLQLVFAERGEIDFTGLSQAACAALGEPEAPTDLLLALDLRLRHVLVDEFQDTSAAQWTLLERLTAGWSPGDGRTAFLVGDPMQSIYRFREADVALFQRAWREGLPCVPMQALRLETNFRSQQGIVDWVNATFREVLSAADDPDAGAVPYADARAHHPSLPGIAARWHAFVGDDAAALRAAEARRVVALAREALESGPAASVAVLVRNRSHLAAVVPALREAGVRFRAVEIEPLAARPVVQDLLAITRALGHPADRVAWLALLRAPWCGLDVAQLHAVCAGAPAHAPVWELLHEAPRIEALGADAARAVRLVEALAPFVEGPLRGSLRERVENAWLALGGPACVEAASDLEDAETFFAQLDAMEEAGALPDAALLEAHLEELYAAPDLSPDARLQLMTVHKSKGLEFDTVIVPGLDRPPREGDKPLFAWKARSDGSLMMAPVHATGEAGERAFDYLCALEHTACEHEAERLFYVAATRAAQRLHLLGVALIDEHGAPRKPTSRSLLGKAWGVAAREFAAAAPPAAEAKVLAAGAAQGVRRVALEALSAQLPPVRAVLPAPPSPEPPSLEFSWVGETARHVGTITHRWLQRIGTDGGDAWSAERLATLREPIERELARRGVPPAELRAAAERVGLALRAALEDARGRWILAARPDARCEYRLRVATPEGVRLVVIDRLFTDEAGQRWIVDYKTSAHEGGELEAFLDRELERYTPQLTRYRSAFTGAVSMGLYFPLVRGWRESQAKAETRIAADEETDGR